MSSGRCWIRSWWSTLSRYENLPERPAVAKRARLRFNEARESHVLLLPERAVLLGESSFEILELCDGSRTVAEIVGELRERYPQAELENDVIEFLREAAERQWLEPA